MAIVLGVIETESELREVIGSPTKLVAGKVADRLNDIFREYIVRSPFLCIATSSADGALDVSPRGDPAGFVRILDEHTLLVPDRPGNKIADTLTNVLATGRVALIFLVPGVGDSFRVNGSARITDDPDLLQGSAVEGKTPRLGLVITVEEAFTQCSKALIRSDLWNPDRRVDPQEMPTTGQMLKAVSDPTLDVDEYERARVERYRKREGLY
ncbi:MAG: pyridoxamine 5'-phosphate oxidase family protein [Actinobacteria bacterium]|nr:pyridoxamine 5'-phosphate oxidase family protein [Actinomycetota bacterium]